MAFTAKFTAQRGKTDLFEIVKSAGAAEATRDTISINVDIDKMSKGETLLLIAKVRDAIYAAKWPPA